MDALGSRCMDEYTPISKKGAMTTLQCPHCGKDLELIGQKELTEEYGLGPNPVAHQRQQGVFPKPALAFGNRNMWLRGDIDAYVEERSRERIAKLVSEFKETLAALPETERDHAIKMLDGGGRGRKKAH